MIIVAKNEAMRVAKEKAAKATSEKVEKFTEKPKTSRKKAE